MNTHNASVSSKGIAYLFVIILMLSSLGLVSHTASAATMDNTETNWTGFLPSTEKAMSSPIGQTVINSATDGDAELLLSVGITGVRPPDDDMDEPFYDVALNALAFANTRISFGYYLQYDDINIPDDLDYSQSLSDDEGFAITSTNWRFCYYGVWYNSIYVSSNGFVIMTNYVLPPDEVPLEWNTPQTGFPSTSPPNSVVAPFARDMRGGSVEWGLGSAYGQVYLWIVWCEMLNQVNSNVQTFALGFPVNTYHYPICFVYGSTTSDETTAIGYEDQEGKRGEVTSKSPEFNAITLRSDDKNDYWLQGIKVYAIKDDPTVQIRIDGWGTEYVSGVNVDKYAGESTDDGGSYSAAILPSVNIALTCAKILAPVAFATPVGQAALFYYGITTGGYALVMALSDTQPEKENDDQDAETWMDEAFTYRKARDDLFGVTQNSVWDSTIAPKIHWKIMDDAWDALDERHYLTVKAEAYYLSANYELETITTEVQLELKSPYDFGLDDGVEWFAGTNPACHEYNYFPVPTPYGVGYHIDSLGSSDSGYDMYGWNIMDAYTVNSDGRLRVYGYFRQTGYSSGCYLGAYVLDADDVTNVLGSAQLLSSVDGTNWVYKDSIINGLPPGAVVRIGIGRPDTLTTDYSLGAEWSNVVVDDTGSWPASIAVTSPNGGEVLQAGTLHSVTWTCEYNPGDYVELKLYKGTAPVYTLRSVTDNDGSYPWIIPADLTPGTDYWIRISSTSLTSVYDSSDNYFSVVNDDPPTVTVLSPNGGENCQAGTEVPITWSSHNIGDSDVSIQLYRGLYYIYTIESSAENDGLFEWWVESDATLATDYRIRISAKLADADDFTDGYFAITEAPTITLTSPNGGENWLAGSTHTITWISENCGDTGLVIQLHTSHTNRLITSSAPNVGSYSWTIPEDVGIYPEYHLWIGRSDCAAQDESDAPFAISISETITVTSPDGGESWTQSSIEMITWSAPYDPSEPVELYLYRGESQVSTISSGVPNIGFYSWTVPSDLAVASDYGIKIRWTPFFLSWEEDYSDDYFSIVAAAAGPAELPYSDSIDNGLDEWELIDTGGFVGIESGISLTPPCLKVFKEWSTGLSQAKRYFEPVSSGTVRVESDIQVSSATAAFFNVYDPSGLMITYLRFSGSTMTYFDRIAETYLSLDGGQVCTPGIWYRVGLIVDMDAGTYDIEVNGVTKKQGIQIYSTVTSAGLVIFQAGYANYLSGIALYGDDVWIAVDAGAPTITVASPNGGESWQAGTTQTIAWTSANYPGSSVKIELYRSTTLVSTISSSTSNVGSYPWTISTSLIASADYRIKVSSTTTSASDYSDAYFSITAAPTITVVSPNGGESWQAGTTRTITWTSANEPGTSVKIELYKSSTLVSLISPSTSIVGPYYWTISSSLTVASDYRIRISSTTTSASDYSNTYFSITAAPTITVVSPNGGESWQAGTTQTITWTSANYPGTPVKIELYKSSTLVSLISPSTSIVGPYYWTISTSLTVASDYRIRISSTTTSASDYSDAYFSITAAPTITVVSPNGGESWALGSYHLITWTSANDPGSSVRIELYRSTTPVSLISLSTSNVGSYPWTISTSLTVATDYRIKVSSTTTSASDYSDAYFSITAAPTITVVSPNGGESWQAGTTQTITWTSENDPGSSVKIELYRSTTLVYVVNPATPNDGSHPWMISTGLTVAADYRIKVSSTTTSASDYSDTYFSITAAPTMTVVSPNGGESWQAGTTQTITWTSANNPSSSVRIELYRSTTLVSTISSSTSNVGSYPWTISTSLTVAADYRIKVISLSLTTSVSDYSDAYFSITGVPTITVASPNGGESWQAGTTQTITWTSANDPGSSVRIELYRSTTLVSTISSSTPNAGSYPWTISTSLTVATDYRIRVSSTTTSASDYSDAYFSITGVPTITVVSPNGGESWALGSYHLITWTSANDPGSSVKIELYKSATLVSTISSSTPNDGSYPWTISTLLKKGTDYLVKISSTTTSVYDYSNSYFTLVKLGGGGGSKAVIPELADVMTTIYIPMEDVSVVIECDSGQSLSCAVDYNTELYGIVARQE